MHAHRRSAVALRHVAFEDLGLLASILDREGWNVSFCEAAVEDLSHPSIERADLLIVLGGPIGAYDVDTHGFLKSEIRLLERRLMRDLPTLGICLGSQLMAKALGSRVYPGKTREIGWGNVQLTGEGLASCLQGLAHPDAKVLHWHGDTFDLPDGARRLAFNAAYDNQAFAYGRNALALQFHLEADPRQLEEWYIGHAVELAAADVSVNHLRAETWSLAATLRHQADAVFSRWIRSVSAAYAPSF